MKTESQNTVLIAVALVTLAVSAGAMMIALRSAGQPDETRVRQMVEQAVTQKYQSSATPALDEARVLAIIDQRLSAAETARNGTTVSEARVNQIVDKKLASRRLSLSDKEFDDRVEKGIVALFEKRRRAAEEQAQKRVSSVPAPNKDDHVYGNPDAPVALIEYADFECPYCKRFYSTAMQVVDESKGQVKWIYRQFPIEQLHPGKARKEAMAADCAAELAGNEAFWKFTNRMFELTLSNNRTDIDKVIPAIAQEMGLDGAKFASCVDSGRYAQHIDEEARAAAAAGASGTPWSIIVSKAGKSYPLAGAQPYAAVKRLTEFASQDR